MAELFGQLWQNLAFQIFATTVTGWMVLSCLLNWAFYFKTPEKWVEFAETYPKGAKIVAFLRKAGVDPVGALKALEKKVEEQAGTNPLPMPPSEDEKKEKDQ